MVKPGYKQTEMGVIPVDWEEAVFGKIVSIYRGGSPRPIQDYLTDSNDGVNWIKIGDVPADGKYVTMTEERIRPEGVSRSREVHSGDFILSNSMSFGRPYILKIDGCIHDGWLTIQNYAEIFTTDYLYYLLSSDLVYKQYKAMAAGSSVKNLNKDKVGSVIVIYPKTHEQQRIAEALSDMDELIASLEKLIAKKKAIKQGAMQELLTGNRRLPGFGGEWNRKPFGYLFDICPNNSYTREQLTEGGKIKNIHYGDILTKCGAYLDGGSADIPTLDKTLEKKKYSEKAFVQDGDVIIADTAEDITVGKAVEIINVRGKMLSGQHTFLCRPIIPFAPMYLGYYVNSEDFHDQIVPLVTGTKVSSISKASLCSITVRYPDIPEQQAIAEVLSDMDKAIIALEKKIRKAHEIKQGMMQQLFTGQIRL